VADPLGPDIMAELPEPGGCGERPGEDHLRAGIGGDRDQLTGEIAALEPDKSWLCQPSSAWARPTAVGTDASANGTAAPAMSTAKNGATRQEEAMGQWVTETPPMSLGKRDGAW
jgi:hypothetical protein